MTDKTLIVRLVERQVGVSDKFEIIEPLEKKVFNFSAVWCLKTIEYGPVNLEKRWQGNDRFKGKNLLEIYQMASNDSEAANVFFNFVRTFAMANLEMKMEDNEVFKNTAKAATALVSGLDDLACKVTDIAMAASTGGASEAAKIVKELASKPEAEVKEKKVELAEAKEELAAAPNDPKAQAEAAKAEAELKATERITQLNQFSKELMDLIFDEKTGGYKKESVPAASALVEKNRELLGPTPAGVMMLELGKGANFAAMKALRAVITKAKESSTTKTSIEDAAMIYGCRSCDINTHVDTSGSKAGCSFGLGEIAKASAALTEQSLCQNRDFIIVPTGAPAEKVIGTTRYKLPFEGAVAITSKGG